MQYKEYIKQNILRCEAGYRGGGIEISLAGLLGKFAEGYTMTAYQNYLGGGMLGSIQNSYSFSTLALSKTAHAKVSKISEELKRYFHELTNHDDDFETASYEENQNRPVAAY